MNTCLRSCGCAFYFTDSIEANVENAEVHVQQANQELSRASDYQVTLTVINCLITRTLCVCVIRFTVAGDVDV